MSEPEAQSVPAPERRFVLFSVDGLELRLGPIVSALLMALGLLILSQLLVELVQHFVHLPDRPANPWMGEYYEHAAELALALVAIRLVRRAVPGDYGLHMPQGRSYVFPAIFWGVLFGIAMTAADYAPQLMMHKPPPGLFQLTPLNLTGWLTFEGIFAGISEETLFRGLLVTYLMARLGGHVTFLNFRMHVGGIIVALFFALAHFGSFFVHPWWMALAQQGYAFALGVFYAYWFEKSRSLLAPVVGHNASNLTEYILIFAMVAYWH